MDINLAYGAAGNLVVSRVRVNGRNFGAYSEPVIYLLRIKMALVDY